MHITDNVYADSYPEDVGARGAVDYRFSSHTFMMVNHALQMN